MKKEQSNPYSTGSGGANFETHVQAAFAVLMLTGQIAPCLPPWPITRIKLQGLYAGFETDDFIVFTKDSGTNREAKLLAQIKHTIKIAKKDKIFGEVIQAAWNDFNDPEIFLPEIDAFALITGPLTATDTKDYDLFWNGHVILKTKMNLCLKFIKTDSVAMQKGISWMYLELIYKMQMREYNFQTINCGTF